MLMEVEREWPWGLAVLGDPEDGQQLPSSLGIEGVARTAATVVAGIQHAIDGPAKVSVSVDEEAPGLLLVHRGRMRLADGRLRLADAAAEKPEDATVPPGEYELRVLVDEQGEPTWVHFALARGSG